MKLSNFMNSLLTNLIPQKLTIDQNFKLEIRIQKAIHLSILYGLQQMTAQNLS